MTDVIELTRNECRALGVLVEKAQTTPGQYPLTLNALRNGSNQKNNRLPITDLSEDDLIVALDALRAKGLVREIMLTDSRVLKYRHHARDVLQVTTSELVVLAELLLRGPQTSGELRGRASRMHPLESLETVENIIESLATREQPLVKRLPPAPGSRAGRVAQLLCPKLHPETPAAAVTASAVVTAPADPTLEARVVKLEGEVAELRQTLESLTAPSGGPAAS